VVDALLRMVLARVPYLDHVLLGSHHPSAPFGLRNGSALRFMCVRGDASWARLPSMPQWGTMISVRVSPRRVESGMYDVYEYRYLLPSLSLSLALVFFLYSPFSFPVSSCYASLVPCMRKAFLSRFFGSLTGSAGWSVGLVGRSVGL